MQQSSISVLPEAALWSTACLEGEWEGLSCGRDSVLGKQQQGRGEQKAGGRKTDVLWKGRERTGMTNDLLHLRVSFCGV